jgi:hypothetical protein
MKAAMSILLVSALFCACQKQTQEELLGAEANELQGQFKDGVLEGIIKPTETLGDKEIDEDTDKEEIDGDKRKSQEVIDELTNDVGGFVDIDLCDTEWVGVIDDGVSNCGGYSKIEVYLDEEDNDAQSSTSGWTGGCYAYHGLGGVPWDPNYDMKFSFCKVPMRGTKAPYDCFQQGANSYGLLMLSYYVPVLQGASQVNIFQDTEDHNNINEMDIDGSPWYGEFGGFNDLGHNMEWSFLYYPSNGSATHIWPEYGGLGYGVFGAFGNDQGTIYCDDEDDQNYNHMVLHTYGGGIVVDQDVPPFHQVGSASSANGNTVYRVSKVN